MADEISTRLVVDGSQALQVLAAMEARLKAIEAAQKRVNGATADYQKRLKETSATSGGLRAGSRIGGGFGKFLRETGEAENLGPSLGRVAVAAAAIGVAFRALDGVIKRRVEQERQVIQLQQSLAKSLESGERARGSQAMQGLGLEGGLRRFIAQGGTVQEAQAFANRAGVGLEEAAGGLAQIQGPGRMSDRIRLEDVAVALSKLGQGDIGGNLKELGAPGAERALALGDSSIEEAVARILTVRNKQQVTADQVSTGLRRTGESRFLRQTDAAQEIANRTDVARIGLVEQGAAAQALNDVLLQAVAPTAAAMTEFNKQLEASIEVQKQLAEAQGRLGRSIANLGLLLGGEGSERNKLNVLQSQAGRVVLGPRGQPAGE